MRYGGPVDTDVIFIIELEELLPNELCVVVRDNGVWYSKEMDDIKEEKHDLLGLDRGDRSGLYPLCKLVYDDKQVRIASGAVLRGMARLSPQIVNGHVMGIVWSAWASNWVCQA